MIRLRTQAGQLVELPPEVVFVELVNPLDKTIQLVFVAAGPGEVLEISPNSAGARRYEAMFEKEGLRFTGKEIRRSL